jgi:hypothetical protein
MKNITKTKKKCRGEEGEKKNARWCVFFLRIKKITKIDLRKTHMI